MCSNKHWLNNLFILVLLLLPMVSYGQSYNQSLVIDGKLYLYTSAWDNTTQTSSNKLWVYDGSSSPTVIKDFGTENINNLQSVGSKLVILTYKYSSGSSAYKFWVYDPSTGDDPVEKVSLGSSYSSNYVVFNDKLYFTQEVYSQGSGYYYYLYSFDGSDKTYVASLGKGYTSNYTVYNSKLYFTQYKSSGSSSGYTFYNYDGTDITAEKSVSNSPNNLIVFNSKLYFTMYSYSNNTSNYKLYSYDGSTFSEQVDLGSNYPGSITIFDSKLYYYTSSYSSGVSSYYLNYYDGTSTSVTRATTISNYPENLTVYLGQLVWSEYWYSGSGSDYEYGYKLKAYDGSEVIDLASSANPPEKAADLITNDMSTWFHDFNVMNSILYYMKGYSAIWKYQLTTIAFTTGYPYTANLSNTNLDIKVKADKDGKAYYVVLADGATAPSAAQVKAATDASGTAVTLSGNTSVYANSEGNFFVENLTASTSYDIYVVAEDNSSNLQSSATKIDVTTTASASAVFASGYPSVALGSDGTTATLKVKVNKASEVYFVILLSTATAPTSQAVHEHSGVGIVAYGSDENLSAATEASLSISGLTASTDYSIYVVLEYNEELQSSPTRIDISTDVVAPAFASGYPAISNEGQTSFTLKVKAGEAGTAYYVVLADGATRPDTTKIKAGDDASGTDATASGKMTIAASVENTASITGLTAGISYDVWVTAEDANGNITTASKKDVTTLALPKKLTVKQDGSGDYPTISSAISAASNATADTVVVYAGTYQENVNFGGKNLVVRSDTGAENTIITPSNNGLAIVWFYNGEPSTAKLIGFTLKDGGALQGSALNIETSSSPTIENCIITNSKGYPVRFYNSASVIKNTLIYNNTGDGVFYFDNYTTTSYPEIINCTVANNTGYGIQNAKSYKPIAKNSIFYGNSSGGAFGNLDITYSIVEGTYTGTGNKDSDPLFKGSANASDYKLTDYSPAIGSATATGAPTTDLASTNRGSPPDIGAYENSLSTPLSDTYVPVVSHVREGSAGDLSFIGTQSQVSAHWNGSDEGSGISYYEYAVDTDNTNITGSVVAWTNAGTDTSVTITGLSLTEGTTYYVSVRAYDVVKNVSVVVTSNGVKVDITTPIAGIVVHGTDTGTHFYWTGNSSSITATWSGFSDAASGIKEYEVLLRDTLNNTNIVDWTNTGTALTKTFSELTLVNNGQYYFKVRASDLVGNLSQFAASGIVQVDTEKPVVTTLVETAEGSEEDIDWVGPGMNVIHRWKGQDNGQILHYEFSAGTSEGATDVIAWANVSLDTTDTTSSENYDEGLTYFTNVQAKDKADNLSDVLTSDGFQFDETPPKTGSVSDGASADIDFSGSESSITFNWTGFEDAGSGINHYMVALGTTPEGEDVLELKDVGDVTSETLSNLYLDHGVTYYCSVMAVDEVGNESDLVSSNGFTVDIYPGPPTVASSSPAGEVFLSLISESEIVFKFSEPVDYGDFDIWSDMSELTFSTSEDQDSIAFILTPPLTSLDTVYINLSNLTDLSGLTGEDTLFTFATELIADYNHDLVIDASDLSSLASGWMNEDYTYELGPVTGEAPHFVPQLDGDYDLRDVMAYTRMWHWYHETPKLLNLARANLGEELEVTVNDKSLAVTIPEHVIAGQLAFQMTGSEAIITLPAEKTGDMIVLSHVEEGLQQSLIDFAYLGGEGKRNFVLPLEFGRYSSTITVSYALYAEGGTIDRQGVKTMDITPVPVEFVLDQNYPNPFNPTTRIEYGLPVNGQVKLTVYDLLGQEVRTLIPGSDQIAGFHNIMWDARDERGVAVSAGVYIYRLAVRGEDGQKFSRTKKMVLLK